MTDNRAAHQPLFKQGLGFHWLANVAFVLALIVITWAMLVSQTSVASPA